MASVSIEQLRVQVALNNPTMTSDAVRREADRVQKVLASIEAEDAMRAAFAAEQAEAERQQAVEAQRRAEALNDARGIVAKSHPGWDNASVEMESQRLVAENEYAIAATNAREAFAES